MDPCFSGEDLVVKTRKPYTITKQRERWTEEEHSRFLEALKLYGRAWQRIEEHIGTKTAIQIRSHAQKFFTKLEKETSVNGAGNALDIEIPPPRPKRKPINPYPRKTCGASALNLGLNDRKPSDPTSTSLSMTFVKENEDLTGVKQQNSDQENGDCLDALNLELVAPCSSPTSTDSSIASEATERSSNFRQFFPLVDGIRNQNENCVEAEEQQLLTDSNRVTLDLCVSPEESSHGEMVHDPIDEISHNCPRDVPVHILGGSSGNAPVMPFMQSMPNQTARGHGDQTVYNNAAAAASENVGDGPRLAIPPPYLNSLPFLAPEMNHEDYNSFMQMSSSFSSLIMSVVAQNAAMYAAASLASTGWPWFNMGPPLEPSVNSSSGIPQSRSMNPTSSMAAIAGATVAAATAWWAANGLLPFCPQYHPGSTCSPAAQMGGSQSGNINGDARGSGADPILECRQPDAELFNAPNSTLKPPSSSSSSDSEAKKLERGLDLAENEDAGSNKFNYKKQLNRSSSGSNTLSSSEIEPDAMEIDVKVNEEKHIKTRENKEANAVLPAIDPASRRSRSSSTPSDPWKEVSEEGRLAFQALFSREVLPQSFPLHDLKNNKHCSKPVEDRDELTMFKLGGDQMIESSFFDIGKKQDSLLNEELEHAKVKAYRTGFRLYKRCSMEAKETRVPEGHKDPKKLRL